uniref:Uncharacterized protein n=1 Tax=Bos mutus grunniens TaxID=30521 RepID=A0A8B9YXC3_BOSMU
MRYNYDQLNLPLSSGPKVNYCILFCKPYSTCHRSYPYPNTLKLHRGHRPDNCPWPYILYTFLKTHSLD